MLYKREDFDYNCLEILFKYVHKYTNLLMHFRYKTRRSEGILNSNEDYP